MRIHEVLELHSLGVGFPGGFKRVVIKYLLNSVGSDTFCRGHGMGDSCHY